MRKAFFSTAVALLLTVAPVWASDVTDVQLRYSHGLTVAQIVVDGAARYTHQTVEAKDGKPFRVIVDVLSATHRMPAKNFEMLPDCPVASIRSSQYSVQPEHVVRVVFDMQGPSVYQIDQDKGLISVTFKEQTARMFANWSAVASLTPRESPAGSTVKLGSKVAKQAVPDQAESKSTSALKVQATAPTDKSGAEAKTASTNPPSKPSPQAAASQPAASDVSRQTVQKSKAKADTKAGEVSNQDAPRLTKTDPKAKAGVSDFTYGPEFDPDWLNRSETARTTAAAPSGRQLVAAQDAGSVKDKSSEMNSPSPSAGAQKKESGTKTDSQVENKRRPDGQDQSKDEDETEKASEKMVPGSQRPEMPKKKQILASADQEVSSSPADTEVEKQVGDDAERSTARFRRSPTMSRKLKGTMVAEFPKRLVVKYKAGGRRDPFATLIDETAVYNKLVEERIPNVEGLILVGVLDAGGDNNRALFEDTHGYGYILKAGDRVQKGYVIRVEIDRVYFQIFEYGWSRTVALSMEEY